jgi:hypothetical protein
MIAPGDEKVEASCMRDLRAEGMLRVQGIGREDASL